MATEQTTTELPETPSFQEAFEAAKAAHSQPAEAETEPAEATTETSETEEPEVETPAEAPVKGKITADPNDLLSDEEFSALQTKHKDDPVQLRKALTKAFTQKTQALAEERRSVKRLERYQDLIDALEGDNPGDAIKTLATEYGVTIGRAEPAETTTEDDGPSIAEQINTEFKQALGPELEYLAEGLAPAITKMVERLTATSVEKATQPLKAQADQILGKAAASETKTVMDAFTERHPDWSTHEDEILALSMKLQPNGMNEGEYLDHLYKMVTAETPAARQKAIDAEVAKGVKAALKKMNKGAEDAETEAGATPDRHVKQARPEGADFHDAFEAAKAGIRWD